MTVLSELGGKDFAKPLVPKPRATAGNIRVRGERAPDTPRLQRLAGMYGVWQTRTNGTYDPGRALAFARLYEPRITPELEELLMRDFTVGVATLEATRFPAAVPFVGTIVDRLLSASDAQLSQVGANLLGAEMRLRQNEAHSTTIADLDTPGVYAMLPPEVALQEQRRGGTGIPEHLKAGAPAMVGNFFARLSGREMTWLRTGGHLAVGIDGESFFDVILDGDIGDGAIDAIVALTEAVYGTRHRLAESDDVAGQQTNVGAFFEFVGAVTDPIFRLKDAIDAPLNWLLDQSPADELTATQEGRRYRSSNEIVSDRTRATLEGLTVDLDSDAVVIAAAAQLGVQGMGVGAAYDLSRAWYDSLTPTERAAVEAEMEDETKASITETLTELADKRHSVKRALDDTVAIVGTAANAWMTFTQSNIVHLADFIEDVSEGVMAIPNEGLGGFGAAFSPDGPLPESAADFMGLSDDNPWRGLVDFAASVAGDPLTWIGISGPMRGAYMRRMLTEEGGAAEFLARPHTQPWLAALTEAQAAGNRRIGVSLLTAQGMTRRGLEEYLAGAPVVEILEREMSQGLFIPTLTGSLKFHNQAVQIRRLASLGDSDIAEYLRGALSQFSTRRNLSLAPDNAMDDRIAVAMARSTVDPSWIADPRLFDDYIDEVLRFTNPDERAAKQVVALQAERQAARRKELVFEARAAGHRPFLQADAAARETSDRLFRLEAEAAQARRGVTDTGLLDDTLRRAEDAMVADPTAVNTADWRAAVAAREAADDTAGRLAAIEDRIDVIRNADERLSDLRGSLSSDPAAATAYTALRAKVAEVARVLPAGYGGEVYAKRKAAALGWLERYRVEAKELERLRMLRRRVNAPGGARAALIESDRRFYESWGRAAGLETPEGRMAWERITGVKTPTTMDGLAEALAMGDTQQAAVLRDILGEGPRGLSPIPVSPMEMVAYMGRHSDEWWSKVMMRNPAFSKRLLARGMENIRKTWTANVLFNPYTFLRSNLDEPIRDFFINGRGAFGRGLKRLRAGFQTVELSDIANAYAYRMARPWHAPGESPQFIAASRTAARFGADELGLESRVGQAAFNNEARHLFNGVLPSRPVVRAWAKARHSGDDSAFLSWWQDQAGRILVPPRMTSGGVTTKMTAEGVLDGWDTVLDAFAHQVPAANRSSWKAAVLKGWAEGDDLSPAVLRQLKVLPSSTPQIKGPMNRGYEMFFGRPGGTHGSLVYEEFYGQAYGVLAARHSEKLLTAERLAEISGSSVTQAKMMLTSSDPLVDDLVRNQGWFTERALHVQASRVARIHADHMAYQMGATSLAGQRLAQVFPFLKAQMDFLGFYWRELTSGSELALSATGQRALRMVGGGSLIDKGLPFLGKSVQIAGSPLNLRLAGRIMDILGTVERLPDEASDDVFGRILNNYTFLPTDLNDDFWLQLQPGLAPIPSWLLHMLPVEASDDDPLASFAAATRRFLDAAWPSFTFNSDQTDATDLFNFVLPDSRVSGRRILERGLEMAVPPGFLGLGNPMRTSEGFSGFFGTPPGFHNLLRQRIADEIAANPGLVKDSDEWKETVRRVTTETYRDATRDAAFDTAKTVLAVSGFEFDADDGQQLAAYEGLIADLSNLHTRGMVGDPTRDEITDLWARYQSGDITYTEATRLADLAQDVLYGVPDLWTDLLVVRHPEIAANLTSQWKCTEDSPLGACRGDRLVIAPGADGRALRAQGQAQGWLVRRDPADLWDDTYARHAAAARRLRTQIWTAATGLKSWSSVNPALPDSRVRVGGFELQALRDLGADVPDGREVIYTRRQLHDLLLPFSFESHVADFSTSATDALTRPYGIPQAITQLRAQLVEEGYDPDDTYTWPEQTRAYVRGLYDQAITQGIITQAEYDRELAPRYGDLAYEAPDPPALAQTAYHFTVDPRDLSIVDGDTVRVTFGDGEQRIRLIGINAAEANTVNPEAYQAYLTQTESLRALIDAAQEVAFAVYAPERFLTTQEVADGEVRWLMWLYLDGRPVFDPDSFTSTQPSGYRIGGGGI